MGISRAVPADQDGVIGESDGFAFAHDPGDGVFHRLTGLLVDDLKDFRQGAPVSFGQGPPRERLGHGIHERHHAPGGRWRSPRRRCSQRGGVAALAFPQPLFGLVFVERHLDRRLDFPVLEGLDDIPERFGDLGALKGLSSEKAVR